MFSWNAISAFSPTMWLSLSAAIFASLFVDVWTVKIADPIVDTGYAKYLGNRTFPNTVAYLGIPYAEPPLGERRFRSPLPLNTARVSGEAKGAVIDAKNYPDFCVQGSTGGGDAGGAGSEDCLKVNIYAPADAKKGSNCERQLYTFTAEVRPRSPPLLYTFYANFASTLGYIFGNPRNWPFDHWIHQSPNVVIVSVYYRLDSLGFLAIPEFADQDSNLGDFNAGFLDQAEALRWVKRHIAIFGGNPDRVTINGESAGGASVELHLVANREEALFAQAIAQSGGKLTHGGKSKQAGCGGSGSTAAQLACLRSASVSALARAQDAGSSSSFTGSLYKTFHPVLDGKLFTDYPSRLITTGKIASVPLIVGATTNETLAGGDTIFDALRPFCPSLTAADADQLEETYPESSFASNDLRLQTVTGDVTLRCARTIMATSVSEKGVPAWTYRYNQRNPTQAGAGVGHAAENWMMFLGTNTGHVFNGTTTFSPMTPTENAFAAELIAYWLSFVRSGSPNTFKLERSPTWPSYTGNVKSRIVLQEGTVSETSGSFIEKETDAETGQCNKIASQASDQQN
ncbi:hypothetical protein H0H93_001028 [Arthromyces matolae]|nr:hypothetical protein H0H93_001028 [Arthromyces matolae]